MRSSILLFALALVPLPASGQTSRPAETTDAGDLWSKFQRVLPRGRIAGIRAPRYVSASEARIRGDAWVLGVVIEGQARAYGLNLLNRHEIVNDTLAGVDFAAVW